MNTLRLVLCTDAEVLSLLDHELTVSMADGKRTEEVYGLRRYRELIADGFRLSGMDVAAGLDAWSRLTGAKI
jgi:hypothetical protein